MRRATVLLLFFLFGLCPVLPAEAATASLYLSPSSGVYSVGNTFSVAVNVNTGGAAINAAEGGLVFSSDKLEVVSISKAGSIFSLWTTEPAFSNSAGTVNFGGGIPNPGYTGAAGKVLAITFRAKIGGTALISFSSGAVLANDGMGTNILSSLGSGSYVLQSGAVTPTPAPTPTPASKGIPAAPQIISSTHPDPDKWHSNSNPEFEWDLPDDITGVSIMMTDKPVSNPGPYSDGLFDSKTYENLEDSISYLHLKLRNRLGWSKITHFKIQIDTKPPVPFAINIKEGVETDNPQPIFLFETTDDLSGIDRYEIKIGESDISTVSAEENDKNPYQTFLLAPGKHTAVVKAVDMAGNETLAMATINILPIDSPVITDYPQALIPGDILTFKGTALSDSTVLVYVQQRGEESSEQEIQSDEKGHWSYVYDKPVERGIYKIWAQTINERGAQSLTSEKITISVRTAVLVKLGKLILDHLTIIISILAFLAIIFFGALYFWQESRRFLKKIRKETEEAEEALHHAFDALREDAGEELKLLNKVKSKRDLTKEENKIRKNLKKNLTIAEKYIAKEISDIKNISKTSKIKEWIRGVFK